MKAMLVDGHKLSVAEVLNAFKIDSETGLKNAQLEDQKKKFGLNGIINVFQ